MDRIQLLLNIFTCCFLIMTALVAFYNLYKKRLFIWLLTGLIFLLGGINKIFGLNDRVGSWLLAGGISFVNFVNRTLPWLKLYKQPGFVVDFWFLIFGFLVVLVLHNKMKQKSLSYRLFFAGVISFLVVVGLGFNLATSMHTAFEIVILQFTKDIFEAIGSFSFFVCFLTYSR